MDADTSTQELTTSTLSSSEAQMNLVPIVTSSVILGIFFCLMVVVVVILVAVVIWKKRVKANTAHNCDPCTQSNLAYELHKPRKRAISVQQNIAYEHSTLPSNTTTL